MKKMKNYILFFVSMITLTLAMIYGPAVEPSTRVMTLPPRAEPAGTVIWQVLPGKALVPGEIFSLYLSPPGQFVVYGRREYGINLDWIKRKQEHDHGAPANFTLSRSSGSGEQIKYGEALALREKTGGFIFYKQRKYGINLEFSAQPAYEWEVRGGRTGTPVTPGNQGDSADSISDVVISLYNRTVGCYVVYGRREYGINLVWKGGPKC